MLRFVLGTAGTGKTTKLVEEIGDAVAAGRKAILLVPEQYSFEAERLLYRALGPVQVLEVEVLSFTRLCNAVFRRLGGLAGVAVTEAGKYLLMSVALGEVKDELNVYQKSSVNPGFLQTMVAACAEFKTAGIAPEKLEELSRHCEPSPLQDKLAELSTIYSAYQGILSRSYHDPDDDLIRAARLLAENLFFSGIDVFVDGFTTFMAAEFALLGEVIAQAENVTFAFTADSFHDEQKGTGVFSSAKSAAARLIRYARRAGVPVAAPEVLQQLYRYSNQPLRHLSLHYLQPAPPAFADDAADIVELWEAKDIYQELDLVADAISSLVCDQGYRYNEIALVARDPEVYSRALESVFGRQSIPYFADRREEVENLPLISGILSALDAVRSNYDPEAVLQFAKSPLVGLDAQGVAKLENYCYLWGVRGAAWLMPFANNPRGLAETLTDEDRGELEEINQIRAAAVHPLGKLKDALKNPDGRRFAQGIYDLLVDINAAESLTAYAQLLEQGSKESFLDQSAQLWDILMEILDVFGQVLGGIRMPVSRICELFRLAVNTAEVAQVPQTLDQVLVGGADRIRPGAVRAVFLLGANEGVFPPTATRGGLFTEAERQQMLELGAEISPPTLQQSVLERYFCYFAAALPSEQLFVSYSKTDPMGREQQPSVLVEGLRALFPGLKLQKGNSPRLPGGEKAAFALLAREYREDTPLTAALLQYFSSDERVEKLRRAAERPVHSIQSRQLAKGLFGGSLHFSPSRVERFYRCPFSYFAADGLSLKKRRKVEFTPLESGSVIHNVLQVMVQRHGGKGLAELTQEEMAKEIKTIINEYLSSRVEDMTALPVRFKYLFTRLSSMLARLLTHMGREFAQGEFQPVAVELPISRSEGVEPLVLETADGAKVSVEGIVDRVDVMEKNGRRYVRVVDYKSGGKDFKLHDILYGLNMQMLLYLFTIGENGKGELADAIPAGVLYMPVRERYISSVRDADEDALEQERQKQWRMNGLLLEDEEVLRGMEQDVAGVFIPAKIGKNGKLDAKSSLASKAEMGRLALKVREMVVQMAGALQQGEICAQPVEGGDQDTCAYCDYRAVCGFEPGDPVTTVESIDRGEFFKRLEEEHG